MRTADVGGEQAPGSRLASNEHPGNATVFDADSAYRCLRHRCLDDAHRHRSRSVSLFLPNVFFKFQLYYYYNCSYNTAGLRS